MITRSYVLRRNLSVKVYQNKSTLDEFGNQIPSKIHISQLFASNNEKKRMFISLGIKISHY